MYSFPGGAGLMPFLTFLLTLTTVVILVVTNVLPYMDGNACDSAPALLGYLNEKLTEQQDTINSLSDQLTTESKAHKASVQRLEAQLEDAKKRGNDALAEQKMMAKREADRSAEAMRTLNEELVMTKESLAVVQQQRQDLWEKFEDTKRNLRATENKERVCMSEADKHSASVVELQERLDTMYTEADCAAVCVPTDAKKVV
eukprot:TRINITY_DN6301_c0_g1_i1.p2 TRINITY_DN6301_c0_g1~~TRINITY_DN6301_c0_g1_i1.p2  ORF type:complete len:201 (+),score=24.44 TRINITY_DN6301_c0_g1_i1:54-656(+)